MGLDLIYLNPFILEIKKVNSKEIKGTIQGQIAT
jgi:hypothetical protein